MMAGWLHWTTSSMERTMLCPYWSRYLFWNGFAFPAYLAYAGVTIRGLTERLIHSHGLSQHCFRSKVSLDKQVLKWPMTMGSTGLSPCSPQTQNCWSNTKIKLRFEDTVTAPISGSNTKGWHMILQTEV